MDQQKRVVEIFDSLQNDDERSKFFIECTEKMDSGLKMELVKMGDKGWEGKTERDFLELYSAHHLEKFKAPFFVKGPSLPLVEVPNLGTEEAGVRRELVDSEPALASQEDVESFHEEPEASHVEAESSPKKASPSRKSKKASPKRRGFK